MIYNILISLAILSLVLISAFALYLPLVLLLKNREGGLRYAIPFSLSVEIIFGYIFYCTSTMRFFPLFYLIFIILMNVWAYIRLKPIALPTIKMNWWILGTVAIVIIALVYTRYFDAFYFIGPGNNDTYGHLTFVKNLFSPGYLSNGYYAPGFHILLMPIAKLIPFSELYRFTGPALGLTTIIFFILLVKDWLKNKILIILLLSLATLPLFNQFSLQTIGFFSSALTFIFFASFIYLISDQETKSLKTKVCLFLIFSVALALTVPYLFVQIFPATLLTFLIVLIFRKRYMQGYARYLLIINLILILGFILSFGHIFIQSKILKRYNGFPGIEVTVGNEVTTNEQISEKIWEPNFIKKNIYLNPMFGSVYDLIRIKNLRSPNSIMSLGAYIWIGFSVLLLIYALRRKNPILMTVSSFSIFFGLYVQTGIFEMSIYRGRSGWYLFMLSLFGIVLIIDQFDFKKNTRWLLLSFVILSLTGFILPPKFYRAYYNEEFKIMSELARKYSDRNLTLIANNYQLAIVSENLTMQQLKPDFLLNENPVLILEKKLLRPDPVQSQSASSTDKNFEDYNKKINETQEQLSQQISRIKEEEHLKKYNIYFENDDFTVYENIKKD